MKLITAIKISNFRSLKEVDISGFENFNVLAGPNNSGKSNLLRALNAFFTNKTDIDTYIDVDNDFFKSDKPFKKKKTINISVTFSKPGNFRFRKDLEHLNDIFIDNQVIISKVWERQEFYPTYFLNNDKRALNSDDEGKVDQFLSLITFRYIPNRVLPLELIRQEHEALRNALIRRFGPRKETELKEVFSAIKNSSSKLIRKMAKDFKQSFPNLDVLLKTPDSWAEMVFALGYRISENQIDFDDSLQGSGIQSLLMFNTLSLIDRDYFQQFGWRQAAIWGVEEPESSLHSNLEAYLASYLKDISSEQDNRLQIFSTTHSDLMMQYSDSVVITNKANNITKLEISFDKKEILKLCASIGISRFVDPILQYPLEPIIFVEGKYDFDFLNRAIKIINPDINYRLTYLEELVGDGKSGGINDILKYIKNTKNHIKTRQYFSPVILLIDWEAKDIEKEFRKHFRANDPFKVFVWPEEESNPKLDNSVKGIERFFSDRIINEVEKSGFPIATFSERGIKKITIRNEDRDKFKRACNNVINRGIKKEDIVFSKRFIERIFKFIKGCQR